MTTPNEGTAWLLTGKNPAVYTMKVNQNVFHISSKSGYLSSTRANMERQFGTIMQTFSAQNWIDKRIRMSCYMKSKDAMKCGAWCSIDTIGGELLQFDNMNNRSIHGTTNWNRYSIVLNVPKERASKFRI